MNPRGRFPRVDVKKKFTALWKVETWFLTGEGRRGLNPGAGSSGGGRRSQRVKSDGGIDPSDPVCAAFAAALDALPPLGSGKPRVKRLIAEGLVAPLLLICVNKNEIQ